MKSKNVATDSAGQPSRDERLWRALQDTHLRVAEQVEFSQQIQRGRVWVVIYDPVRNLSYKTTPEIHQLLSSLSGELTLREILARRPELTKIFADQSAALHTLAQLLESGLLQGDLHSDYAEEIAKHRDKQRALGQMRWQRPWMLKLPLFNPDTQLDGLYRKTWFIWTRAGLAVWIFTIVVAAVLLLDHFSHLQQFWATRFLDPVNLVLLLLVYPCLKALHELAHGLTTKKWGGQVYEVGLMFLVFMPVPYVDASASARFPSKYQRMLVAASGVMTELFCAAIALFVWLASDNVLVRDICLNIMIMGAISSLLFNGNPLLRFDGYYVLSDALEIPNLGTRASLYLKNLWHKVVLGVAPTQFTLAPGEKKWLLLYGVLSGVYRLILSFAVAMYIAGHYFFIGIVLAVWALILQILLPLWKGLAGAFATAKNQSKQRRFWLMHALLAMSIYVVLFVLPMRHATEAHGLIALEGEHQIKAGAEGFLQRVLVNSGEIVDAGQPLLVLENAALPAELNAVLAQIAEQEVLLNHYLTHDPTQAGLYRDELERLRQQERDLRDDLANLTVRSAVAGRVEISEQENLPGRYLRKGDLLGHILAPQGYRVTALVPERLGNQLVGDVQEVRVKSHSNPHLVYLGANMRPTPQASAQLPDPVLGSLRGGMIPVDISDAAGTSALQAFFQVEMGLQLPPHQAPAAGRAEILFIHSSEPLGRRWWRQLRLLVLDRFQV